MILIKKNGQFERGDGESTTDIFTIVSESGVEDIIEDKEVPALTEDQLQDAYYQAVNGKVVIIESELGENFIVKQACEESDKPVIYFDYADTHILRYELDEEVEITAKAIGGGGITITGGYTVTSNVIGLLIFGKFEDTNTYGLQSSLSPVKNAVWGVYIRSMPTNCYLISGTAYYFDGTQINVGASITENKPFIILSDCNISG